MIQALTLAAEGYDVFGWVTWDRLLLLGLWLGSLALFTRLVIFALAAVAEARPKRRERVTAWIPAVRLIGMGLGAAIIAGFVTPDEPQAKALVFGGLAVSLLWLNRDVLRNISGGLVIMVTRGLRVGEHVRIGDVEGRIVSVTLRGVEVERADGGRTIIPNQTLHVEATTYAPSPGRAPSVTLSVVLPESTTAIPPERIRLTALRMGLLSPRRVGSPVLVEYDEASRRLELTATPFCAEEAEPMQRELRRRLRGAFPDRSQAKKERPG